MCESQSWRAGPGFEPQIVVQGEREGHHGTGQRPDLGDAREALDHARAWTTPEEEADEPGEDHVQADLVGKHAPHHRARPLAPEPRSAWIILRHDRPGDDGGAGSVGNLAQIVFFTDAHAAPGVAAIHADRGEWRVWSDCAKSRTSGQGCWRAAPEAAASLSRRPVRRKPGGSSW